MILPTVQFNAALLLSTNYKIAKLIILPKFNLEYFYYIIILHCREKLSAPDLIVISKVADYIQSKTEGKNPVEVLCMDQVS